MLKDQIDSTTRPRSQSTVPVMLNSMIATEGNSMRAFIIRASLVLAVTQVGPALGEDANHIIPGCRAVTDEQSFKDSAEANPNDRSPR